MRGKRKKVRNGEEKNETEGKSKMRKVWEKKRRGKWIPKISERKGNKGREGGATG